MTKCVPLRLGKDPPEAPDPEDEAVVDASGFEVLAVVNVVEPDPEPEPPGKH